MLIKALLVPCVLVLLLSCAYAQSAGPRVDLSLIVTDKDNKSIDTIRKEDVHVFEDKVEQTLLNVEVDERPLDLGIAIDASGSFQKWLEPALAAAKLLIDKRRPDGPTFIERFVDSDTIENVQDFTADTNALTEALDAILVGEGQSAVVDAVYLAAQHLAEYSRGVPRRKALVLITDGNELNSFYKTEALVKLLHAEGVQVFVIGVTSNLEMVIPGSESRNIRVSPRERAEKLLRTIADESGGRVFFPRKREELTAAMIQVIGDLQKQFLVTYESTNATSNKNLRKVEIRIDSPAGEKRVAAAPRGYYYLKPVPKPSDKKSQ